MTHLHSLQGRPVILVVDDERGPRESLRMILRLRYEVLLASDAARALELLRTRHVDLVTLDLNMPGIQGEELMRIIRREFPRVEIVIVTGHGSLETATEALRAGVGDYLQKPFDVVQVNSSVSRCLARRGQRDRLVDFLDGLGSAVGYRDQIPEVIAQVGLDPATSRRVSSLLDQVVAREPEDDTPRTAAFLQVLATTVETQSGFLRGHARRTAFYAGLLADRLLLSTEEREHVRMAGFLHDIGKIGVPTGLLLRPSALTPKERALMERHPELGARLVEPLGLPTAIAGGIRHHHEWWDGRGYGDGLYGEQIPLSARIVAVADAYDAMSCDRPYRKALPAPVVRAELDRYAGVQFDPALAREFLRLLDTSEAELAMLADATGAQESRDQSATALHFAL